MPALYADENFPAPVVRELRHLGHDVLTAHEAGKANLKIPVLLTLNRRHFLRIHASRQHSGIALCTADPDFVGQAHRIHEALAGRAEWANTILRINCASGQLKLS